MIRAFEGGSGAFDHGKKNYWYAREDGIYFTHGREIKKEREEMSHDQEIEKKTI
ncbi:BnaA09g09610D [Brassica napus]|uniref:BnaA09g09610D protein n=1 Tax=Brassica napus TaxID=3708 RepID=A0A078GXT6_BRANA|nr:BnaA09g09610D [Brassica napus]